MKKILLLASCLAVVSACKKDNDNTPSRLDLLTAKSWRISAQTKTTTSSTGTPTTVDEYAKTSACDRDDFSKFNSDKTLLNDAGATKCNTNDSQTEKFTWDFNGDQTKLVVSSRNGIGSDTVDIVELTATTLHIRFSSTNSGVTTTEDTTFTSF